MKYWLVVGINKYDSIIVASDKARFSENLLIFESEDGRLVLALNKNAWTSIQPMTVDEFYVSHYPVFNQKDKV